MIIHYAPLSTCMVSPTVSHRWRLASVISWSWRLVEMNLSDTDGFVRNHHLGEHPWTKVPIVTQPLHNQVRIGMERGRWRSMYRPLTSLPVRSAHLLRRRPASAALSRRVSVGWTVAVSEARSVCVTKRLLAACSHKWQVGPGTRACLVKA